MPHLNSECSRDFFQKIATLRRFSERVEGFLAQESEALAKQVAAEMARKPPHEREDYFDAHLDDMLELSNELPSLLRFGIIAALDSAFEYMLADNCAAYKDMLQLPLTLRDLSGSSLERCHNYLKKVVHIPFPDDVQEWTDVTRLHELRNVLVHTNGAVALTQTGDKLSKWLPHQPGLTGGTTISVGREFVQFAISTCCRFVELLDKSMADKRLTAFQSGFTIEAEPDRP
jgi:hypothetical protein